MPKIKWEYIPVVGLIVTMLNHLNTVKKYLGSTYQRVSYMDTWDAGAKAMISIGTTFIPAILLVVILALTS